MGQEVPRSLGLHPFYPILPDADWIARLVPLGIRTVQLRLKNADIGTIRDHISRALTLCRAHACQLIVNDYWDLALELGADFVHLGQEDLAKADVAALRRAGCRLGISTHSHGELETALAVDPDYVALGPIWETKLKKMTWAPQGLERITEWKTLAKRPLVAIGGITLERAPAVYDAGADSIAVVTDIVRAENPESRVRSWLSLVEDPSQT